MRSSSTRSVTPWGRTIFVAVVGAAAGSIAACGLSLSGLAPLPEATADASPIDATSGGDASGAGGNVDAGGSPGTVDSASDDSSLPADGSVDADAAHVCVPFDAGLNGTLALSAFTVAGTASYNENSDGRITLTNSDNNQAGAAWYPVAMPATFAGYDLTWSLRVGPTDTAGDGITFAVLAAGAVPGVGDDGDGLGLRNVRQSDGGVPSGYAVDVDMFQNSGDPTDLGATTLKLVTMPAFTVVAETLVPSALNDGNTYAVDVSWRAPGTLSATLHELDGGVVTVSSSAPGLAASSAYFGFTGATGGTSDSHNEIGGVIVTETCE